MSCYQLPSKDPDRFTCRVGYDSGTQSFYAYIARPLRLTPYGYLDAEKNGHVIKWVGTETGELPTIESLVAEINGFADLTEEVKTLLISDQRRAANREMVVKAQVAQ